MSSTGFPVPNPTTPYWQDPPLPIANHRSTPKLPASARYAIVGSGITGAAVAHHLLRHDPTLADSPGSAGDASVLALEARTAVSGATGRNGGHCNDARFLAFARNRDRYGQAQALAIEHAQEEAVAQVVGLAQREEGGIECNLRRVDFLLAYNDEGEWAEVKESLEERKKVNEGNLEALLREYKVLEAEEARSVSGLGPSVIGAIEYQAWTLSPYKLIGGLWQKLVEKPGINLQTGTTVTSIEQVEGVWALKTDRGTVLAENVILATNAYTAALYPPLAKFLTPTRGQISAIRPGSKVKDDNDILEKSLGLQYTKSGDYLENQYNKDPRDGLLIFGGGRDLTPTEEQPCIDDATVEPIISKYLKSALANHYFGREKWGEDGEVVREWTGIMGFTEDTYPLVGQAPWQKGLWICAGFHGNGMALAMRSAEAIVGMMMGKEEEVSQWLPKCFRLDRVEGTKVHPGA